MALSVDLLTPQMTHPLRHTVLRKGRPLSTCLWDGDDLPTTCHFGLREAGHPPVAIISCYQRPPPHRPSEGGWQLRGLAVTPAFQRRGYGARLVEEVMARLKVIEPEIRWVWGNARTSAIGLYVALGCTQVGEVFNIEAIGPHIVVERRL